MRSLFPRFLLSLRKVNLYILVIGPIVLSLLLLGLLLFLGDRIYRGDVSEVYQAASGIVFLFIASFSGVFQTYRREGLGPIGSPVFGIWPIINGILITVVCWASIIYLIVRMYILIKA
jgi:hypothetical protein